MQKAITLLAISGMTFAAQHGAAHSHAAHHVHGEHAHHHHAGEHAHHHHAHDVAHHHGEEHHAHHEHFGALAFFKKGAKNAPQVHGGEHAHAHAGEHVHHGEHAHKTYKNLAKKRHEAKKAAALALFKNNGEQAHHIGGEDAKKMNKKHKKHRKQNKNKDNKKDDKKEKKNAPANAQLWGLPKVNLSVLHGEQAHALLAKGQGLAKVLAAKVHDKAHEIHEKVHDLVHHGEHAHAHGEDSHAHHEHAHAEKKVKAPAALGLYELSNLLNLNQI